MRAPFTMSACPPIWIQRAFLIYTPHLHCLKVKAPLVQVFMAACTHS